MKEIWWEQFEMVVKQEVWAEGKIMVSKNDCQIHFLFMTYFILQTYDWNNKYECLNIYLSLRLI